MISRSLLPTWWGQSRVSSVPCPPFQFPVTPDGFPQSVMCSIALRRCAETRARNAFLSKYSQDDSSCLYSKPNIRTREAETSKIHPNSEVTAAVSALAEKVSFEGLRLPDRAGRICSGIGEDRDKSLEFWVTSFPWRRQRRLWDLSEVSERGLNSDKCCRFEATDGCIWEFFRHNYVLAKPGCS